MQNKGMSMRITSISMKNNFSFQKKNISIIEKNNQYEFSQFSSRCLEFQALSNISFGVRPAPPIYLIDSDLNCKLYSRQSELAKELGVSPQRVSGCLNGRRSEIEGKIIVYNHQVEKKLDDGTSVLDKKKVAEIYNQRINPRTVYAMDYLGNVTKYENINKIESTKGLFIIPACDVESFDENGQLILDKKKIAIVLAGIVVIVTALVLLLGGKEDASPTASASMSTNEGRIRFLEEFGWKVASSPKETTQVRIPAETMISSETYQP